MLTTEIPFGSANHWPNPPPIQLGDIGPHLPNAECHLHACPMADACRLAHARPWAHSVPLFREPLRPLEPRRCWINQVHREIAGEPEKTQRGRVLPPAVVDEVPAVPYGPEKLVGAGGLTQ